MCDLNFIKSNQDQFIKVDDLDENKQYFYAIDRKKANIDSLNLRTMNFGETYSYYAISKLDDSDYFHTFDSYDDMVGDLLDFIQNDSNRLISYYKSKLNLKNKFFNKRVYCDAEIMLNRLNRESYSNHIIGEANEVKIINFYKQKRQLDYGQVVYLYKGNYCPKPIIKKCFVIGIEKRIVHFMSECEQAMFFFYTIVDTDGKKYEIRPDLSLNGYNKCFIFTEDKVGEMISMFSGKVQKVIEEYDHVKMLISGEMDINEYCELYS